MWKTLNPLAKLFLQLSVPLAVVGAVGCTAPNVALAGLGLLIVAGLALVASAIASLRGNDEKKEL